MSLRPELPYTGPPVQRLSQKSNDLDRRTSTALVRYQQRVTRGRAIVIFSAAVQGSVTTVTVPSTSGNVSGVASADVAGFTPCFCTVTDNANGTATIRTFTYDGSSITGSTTVFYEVWPA